MAYAITAVALGVVLQWVSLSMGETAKPYTESEQGDQVGAEGQTLKHPESYPDGDIPQCREPDLSCRVDSWANWQSLHAQDVASTGSNPVESTTLYPPSPTPSVVEAATARVSSQGGQLTEAEAIAVLQAAGWPTELIPQALAVAWCESKWSPAANGDSGRSKGWFQLNTMWFGYAGEDPAMWADPLVNARTALAVYRYEQARGYAPFANWSCRVALN